MTDIRENNREILYTNEAHAEETVLRGMEILWEQELLCDVAINVGGQTFNTHRVILSACSEFFSCMFNTGFMEVGQDIITLKGISRIAFEKILRYIYTGEITISEETLVDILDAAEQFQMESVRAFIGQFMSAAINMSNCLKFLKSATMYNMEDILDDSIDHFILMHFNTILQDSDMLTIPLDLLCYYLSSDSIVVSSETKLFNFAIKWIKHDPSRLKDATGILECIRFGLINARDIFKIVSKTDIVHHSSKIAQRLVEASQYHMKPFIQPLQNSIQCRLRSNKEVMIILGGCPSMQDQLSNDILATYTEDDQVVPLMHIGNIDEPLAFAVTVVINQFLYVLGGSHTRSDSLIQNGRPPTNHVTRFDPRTMSWFSVASMNESRSLFTAVLLNENIYCIGGQAMELSTRHDSVEKYDFYSNEWTYVEPLPLQIYGHASCSFDGKIYMSGGSTGDNVIINSLLCYNPAQNKWQRLAPMNDSRSFHVMQVLGDRIFVAGGVQVEGFAPFTSVSSVEAYNPSTNEWTLCNQMYLSQSFAASVVLDDILYVIGGLSSYQGKFDIIQRYNYENDEWLILPNKLPQRSIALMAAAMTFPLYVLQR